MKALKDVAGADLLPWQQVWRRVRRRAGDEQGICNNDWKKAVNESTNCEQAIGEITEDKNLRQGNREQDRHMDQNPPRDVSSPSALQQILSWRTASSGMVRRVALVRTDVSEKLSASFIRVTRIGKLGTTHAGRKYSYQVRFTRYFFAACVGC
jgi:hypothetical protein